MKILKYFIKIEKDCDYGKAGEFVRFIRTQPINKSNPAIAYDTYKTANEKRIFLGIEGTIEQQYIEPIINKWELVVTTVNGDEIILSDIPQELKEQINSFIEGENPVTWIDI